MGLLPDAISGAPKGCRLDGQGAMADRVSGSSSLSVWDTVDIGITSNHDALILRYWKFRIIAANDNPN